METQNENLQLYDKQQYNDMKMILIMMMTMEII